MKFLQLFFIISFTFCYSQQYSKAEKELLKQTFRLDSLMQNNDPKILDLFMNDVSFGHSNGWIQNLKDFKKDFASKKVVYNEIKQTEVSELKRFKNTFSIRRKMKVSGLYKNESFEMNLALLEIWIKKKSAWKLWSRQSVEIK